MQNMACVLQYKVHDAREVYMRTLIQRVLQLAFDHPPEGVLKHVYNMRTYILIQRDLHPHIKRPISSDKETYNADRVSIAAGL